VQKLLNVAWAGNVGLKKLKADSSKLKAKRNRKQGKLPNEIEKKRHFTG
jgi:hypothetical protein